MGAFSSKYRMDTGTFVELDGFYHDTDNQIRAIEKSQEIYLGLPFLVFFCDFICCYYFR